MATIRNLRPFLGLLVPLLLVPACGDDDPVTPPEFEVVIEVKDAQGNPRSGLDLAVVPDTQFYMDGKDEPGPVPVPEDAEVTNAAPSPFFPTVTVHYHLVETTTEYHLGIEDIEGNEVRSLKGEVPGDAGVQTANWDGRDDAGDNCASGVYYARLTVPATEDNAAADSRRAMLLAAMDPAGWSVGTTDEDGQIVLKDKRLFPHLYELDPLPAVDEAGQEIGTIVLTPTMRFYLADPVAEWTWRFDREVAGSCTLQFVTGDLPD